MSSPPQPPQEAGLTAANFQLLDRPLVCGVCANPDPRLVVQENFSLRVLLWFSWKRLVHSPPSLHHFVMQGLLPPVWWGAGMWLLLCPCVAL